MPEFLPPVIAELGANIGEFKAKMAEARAEMTKTTEHGGGAFGKLSTLGKGALLGLGAAAVAVGTEAVHLADKYEAAHARLKTAIENSGGSWEQYAKQVGAVSKSATQFGYSKDQVEEALAGMTTGMGSAQKAVQNLGLAEDLAAYKHISLSQAGTLVTKASEGQIRALKMMGIDLPIAASGAVKVQAAQDALTKALEHAAKAQAELHDGHTKASKALADVAKANDAVKAAQEKVNTTSSAGSNILAALHDKLKGQATAAAETFGGRLKAMEANLKNVGIEIGMKLIPILTDLMGWFSKHKEVLIALAAVIGGALLVAIGAYVASMIAAAAATIAATWPIIAIVAALAALAAGVIWLWNNWDQVWSWIMNHKAYAAIIAVVFPIIGIIVALVGVAKFLYDNWSTIWTAVQNITQTVWGIIGPIITNIGKAVMDVVHLVSDLIQGDWSKAWDDAKSLVTDAFNAIAAYFVGWGKIVAGIFDTVWTTIKTSIKTGINDLIDLLNTGIDAIDAIKFGGVSIAGVQLIPSFGGLGIPHIPHLAEGGIVTQPTLALVGERGPEAVVPLNRGFGSASAGPNITVHAQTNADAHEIAREIAWQLKTA